MAVNPALGAALVGVILATASCVLLPETPSLSRQEKNWLLSGKALLGDAAQHLVLLDKPYLALNDEMLDFLYRYVPRKGRTTEKIDALINALRQPGLLGFDYAENDTYTAAEAFYYQSGNCLTFTALLIAMARKRGLNAHFNEVDIPPSWGMQGDKTFILYKHINASIEQGRGQQVIVDVTPDVYDLRYPQRIVADDVAEAQYYNNLAVDFMASGDRYQAFRHFKKAFTLNPKASYLWSNLGTLYQRNDHYREAEQAFLHALALDSANLAAISSLERLYLYLGEEDKALLFRHRAETARNNNPYYRFIKAKAAFAEMNYRLAIEHSQAAIKGEGSDHRFHFLLGQSYLRLGKQHDAETALARAVELAGSEQTRVEYQSEFQRLRVQNESSH